MPGRNRSGITALSIRKCWPRELRWRPLRGATTSANGRSGGRRTSRGVSPVRRPSDDLRRPSGRSPRRGRCCKRRLTAPGSAFRSSGQSAHARAQPVRGPRWRGTSPELSRRVLRGCCRPLRALPTWEGNLDDIGSQIRSQRCAVGHGARVDVDDPSDAIRDAIGDGVPHRASAAVYDQDRALVGVRYGVDDCTDVSVEGDR